MSGPDYGVLRDSYLTSVPPWGKLGTLLDLLEHQAGATRGRITLRFIDSQGNRAEYTLDESLAQAARYASALAEAGCTRSSVVALVADTGSEAIHAFLGCLWGGYVPLFLAPPGPGTGGASQLARIQGILKDSGARLLVADHPLSVDGIGTLSLRSLAESARRAGVAQRVISMPSDVAFIQYTSGSTGRPKRAPARHGVLMEMLQALGKAFWIHPGDVVVNWLPMHHDLGLILFFLAAVGHGASGTYLPARGFVADVHGWLRLLSELDATFTGGPAFSFRLCERAMKAWDVRIHGGRPDLSSVSRYLCGGERVPAGLVGEFCHAAREFGLDERAFQPGYGLAENVLGVSCKVPGSPVVVKRREEGDVVSVGAPIDGCVPRIVSASGDPLAEGEIGEIVLDSRYSEQHPLHTGDLGLMEDGELFVVGRLKDLIVHAGVKYAPEDIEEACAGIPGVGRCAAIGVPSDVSATENIWIFVERHDSKASDAREMEDAEARIAGTVVDSVGAKVHRVVWVEKGSLPRTSSGKLQRGLLRERAISGAV